MSSQGKNIAVLATHKFDDAELGGPIAAVRKAGAAVAGIASAAGAIESKKGSLVAVDKTTAEANAADFDDLLLPGGTGSADKLRMDESAVNFVREVFKAEKPTGVICHGGWIFTDANALRGRTLTSYSSIETDLRNDGSTWVDEEVHVDKGLVFSCTPTNLPAFNAKATKEFGKA